MNSEIIPSEENFLLNSDLILSSSASLIFDRQSGQTTTSSVDNFLLQEGQNLGRKKSKKDVTAEL
ncbi:MAG TPA: hypothetical protein VGA29_01595 [Ignavibacteriaceae bacterium]